MPRQKFAIAAVFDTETCNLGNDAKTACAIPILYIDNDIRDIDLADYMPDRDDNVNFYRYENEYINQLHQYIEWGKVIGRVPIVCAYNLMFDLQSLMETLNNEYDIEVNAQSSTNVYTLDLCAKDSGKTVLRFWDTYHLDMRGLAKMGEVAGLQKAIGSWDYDKVRTPETLLTDKELYYAKRDTQVIPAFLRFLLQTNDWLRPEYLGSKVLTKTSLVRQMAKHEIAPMKTTKQNGKKITVEKMFLEQCKQDMPKTYNSYGVRRACFRGGYTFTAAAFASTIQYNVVSVDVTSMHHTFINGRMIPDKFSYTDNESLKRRCKRILETSREHVMENYHKPFDFAIHARIRFDNIRIRRGTAFEAWGIALEPMSKFKGKPDITDNESQYTNENALIEGGWTDSFCNATFAFGKLYRADTIVIHVNEVELWTMGRVYEWDSMEVIYGESTGSFCRPPDYVTLQSNMLYKLKDDNKFISNHYIEGTPYTYNIPVGVPSGYADGLRDGTLSWADFNAYYISDTKGKFNGIYGTMAQDVYKPSYTCKGGEISVDRATVVTASNWKDKRQTQSRVLYTYGMRIVAGSRLHMVLAIERMYETFGNRVRVLGGDTDSMKMSVDEDVTDDMISDALKIFEEISKRAIDYTMQRVRRLYPKFASTLRGIGGFEIENEGNHYANHIELWNKCRVSVDKRGGIHVTCAGLPRPTGQYHIERFIQELCASSDMPEQVLAMSIGYNVFASNAISHTLESHRPAATDRVKRTIVDYRGYSSEVDCHEVICLYPTGRWLGETLKRDNANTVKYLQDVWHRNVDTNTYRLMVNGSTIEICQDTDFGIETKVIGESKWILEHL